MAGSRKILAAIGIAGVVTLAAPAGTTDAQAAPYVAATPSSAAPGTTITIAGELACPDMIEGDEILLSLHYETLDQLLIAGLDSAPYPTGDTFSVQTAVPTTMVDRVTRDNVATPPGQHRLMASCSRSNAEPPTVMGTLTVTGGGGTTTTTSTTTTSTTTTTAAPTTTTGPTAPPTTVPTPGFTPPSTAPAGATPFDTRPAGPITAGETVIVDETGFVPGETVHVVLYSDPVVLGSATADAGGRIWTTVAIPDGTAVGEHTLVLYGAELVRAMAVEVVAAPDDGPRPPATGGSDGSTGGSSDGQLPRTGASTSVLVLAGIAALGAGAGLLHLRRRFGHIAS